MAFIIIVGVCLDTYKCVTLSISTYMDAWSSWASTVLITCASTSDFACVTRINIFLSCVDARLGKYFFKTIVGSSLLFSFGFTLKFVNAQDFGVFFLFTSYADEPS